MDDVKKMFSVKRIAAQAGVSKATVDRVLHQRGSVHYQTARRVQQAIEELAAQEKANLASGRTFYIDLIMHAPKRFTHEVAEAFLQQVGSVAPFRISPRLHLFEETTTGALYKLMQHCKDHGSQGVVLKVPDEMLMNQGVNELQQAGIPVVTLVTDLPKSQRIAYVGMDNRSAGETAAYLLSQWLDTAPRAVGVVVSSQRFRGEEEREMGFRYWLREHAPYLQVVEISGGLGIHDKTQALVEEAIRLHPGLSAVYSAGGGNRAIIDAFVQTGRPLAAFIGHDLDEENRQLLMTRQLNAIIDHDLHTDARHAYQHLLQYHRQIPTVQIPLSRVQIITPFNMPL
ncbi:LacI family DNA-binding transcriptional regulator [Leeia oryzae]|uniref:LacI family DNA-binding transcriptional regulator n=1 Tax=Leeia oryzae TaxID=356662 RepID=UPI0003672F52|nr:LacI family DNA-binding transcriptional regulator [Leeia oryzae]